MGLPVEVVSRGRARDGGGCAPASIIARYWYRSIDSDEYPRTNTLRIGDSSHMIEIDLQDVHANRGLGVGFPSEPIFGGQEGVAFATFAEDVREAEEILLVIGLSITSNDEIKVSRRGEITRFDFRVPKDISPGKAYVMLIVRGLPMIIHGCKGASECSGIQDIRMEAGLSFEVR